MKKFIMRLKRFLLKKRCYTAIVIIILTILTVFGLIEFCITDLPMIKNEQVPWLDTSLTKAKELIDIWTVGLVFILFASVIDLTIMQTRIFSLSKVDIINDKEIYREILKKYSVLGLSYIDDFKNDIYKYAVIMILNLELKNKIKVNENGIEILSDSNLRESEKYIISRIRSGILEIENPDEFVSLAKKDGLEDGLVEKNPEYGRKIYENSMEKLVKKGIKKGVISFIAIAVIVPTLWMIGDAEKGIFEEFFEVLTIMLCGFAPLYLLGTYVAYEINTTKVSFRTELGEDINTKLEGLKNYIKNYSLLSEKEKEQLKVWDEYLIYSVMFDQNKKVALDVGRFIYFKE